MNSADTTMQTELDDQRLAVDLAAAAGTLLLEVQRSSGLRGRELGDQGDARSNELLLALLAEARPGDCVLSEESADDPSRLSADRVWIIDPVDGTREFGLGNRPDWAVHVALWERGLAPGLAGLTASAVALPALGLVLGTNGDHRVGQANGDHRVGQANGDLRVGQANEYGADNGSAGSLLPPRENQRPRIVLSASRPPEFAEAVASAVAGQLVPLGSAGAKAAAVVLGEADAYIHAGGQYQWDSAAPAGVALAREFVAMRTDGSPLEYNLEDTYLPDLVVCRPELREAILAAIAG